MLIPLAIDIALAADRFTPTVDMFTMRTDIV